MDWFGNKVAWSWANNLSAAIGILGFLAAVGAVLWKDASVAEFTVCAIALVLLGRTIYVTRKEKYANVSAVFEEIASWTSQALGPDCADDRDARLQRLANALDGVCKAFSLVTGTHCRAAIKVIGENGNFVFVLIRDNGSWKANKNDDRERMENEFDQIAENPHIRDLLADSVDGEDHAVFGNIPAMLKSGRYSSTSVRFALSKQPSAATGDGNGGYVLGYKSAAMAVIRAPDGQALGFLAVDSKSRGVFRRDWDGPLLVALTSLFAAAVAAEQSVGTGSAE